MIHTERLIEECRIKLIQVRSDLLNQIESNKLDFADRDFKGDEADLSVSMLYENQLLVSQQRIREKLLEVELALARIEKGNYGRCEETDEAIEANRLLAIPWTRLSIEGAEMREAARQKYKKS